MSLPRIAALFVLAFWTSAQAAEWKPAPSPLMTKWGKKVTPANAWQEYPRPQMVRKDWQNLNGLWDYAITKKDAPKPEKWDGEILVPFCAESALSGVGKPVTPEQNLWYRRTVEVPEGWKGKRVLLHFGAVDWQADVSVNGKEIGTHKGGSDPFSFEITDALKASKNELIMKVWDPTDTGSQPRGKQKLKPEGIWYTPVTGIWQTVWMEPVADGYVTSIRTETAADRKSVTFTVDGLNLKEGDTFDIWAEMERGSGGEGGYMGRTEFGKPVALGPPPGVQEWKAWTPDEPRLYKVRVVVHRGKTDTLDTVESYFAVRTVGVGKDEAGIPRMMLNNKPVFQVGPLDQGWWPDGLLTPPSDAAMKYDLEVLKKLGFNMLRKHIKVEPARFYRHCDELGLLVWQDMPSGFLDPKQFVQPNWKEDAVFGAAEKKQFRAELKALIDHQRGFACIVVWVPFNEGWGQHDTNEILKWVKEYDPTRLVNGPSGWTDRGYGDMKDMHNYPGPGMFPAMKDRISVLGEFGGLGLPIKDHLWKDKDNWGYQNFKTTEDLRTNYPRLMLRMHTLIGKGLSAAVYTQTTDVEVEVNGLMTYDREIIKFDVAETAKWHKALFGPLPEYVEFVPTSKEKASKWRYTEKPPADGWMKADFDDAQWTKADGGFGTKITPNAVVRTEWKSPDIWTRTKFELVAAPDGEVLLTIFHDEDAEIYLNGVLAAKVTGFTTDFVEVPISTEASKSLKTGVNTMAIHCKQTGGGQFIDAGLVRVRVGPGK